MTTVDLLLERSIIRTVDAIVEQGLRDSWDRVEQGVTLIFALGAEAEREGTTSSA